jgi:hypothetical protein
MTIMKKNAFYFNMFLFALVALVLTNACKKEDDPVALTLSTLLADDIDLNSATAPSNVAAAAVITATFSTPVDTGSATSANISLVQEYDTVAINVNIAVAGAVITITPTEQLGRGTKYILTIKTGLKATNGQMLANEVVKSFITDGIFIPKGALAYWNFEDDAKDQVGSFDASKEIAVSYTDGRKTAAGKAATFNGTTSLIEIPNGDELMNTSDFALSFWVKAENTGKGHFVMGLAGWNGFQFEIFGDFKACKLAARYELADGTTATEDTWFPANGNVGWQGWTFCADWSESGGLPARMEDKWANVVCMYNSATKVGSMYINGEKAKTFDFNLWPDGDVKQGVVGLKYAGSELGNQIAFGFIQASENVTIADGWADYAVETNNHFKGQLDDVIIYHKVLTEKEMQLMYDSGKP